VHYVRPFLLALAVITAGATLAAFGPGAAAGTGDHRSAYDASDMTETSARSATTNTPPLEVRVISPRPNATAGDAGTFSVDLSIAARSASSNALLADYTPGFIDPNSPQFHPGPDAFAPGLVVLLSTTPTIPNTPLQGANTNLAGVFQINDVSLLNGRRSTFNSWLVGVPGFFGQGVTATLTVFVVNGTAPALVDGTEQPISNVVRESFNIAN
jgi:hypothetical protein